LEVGATPSRVKHHLEIVKDDVALAFTVKDEDTDPDGIEAHVTVGTATATVNVVEAVTEATD
jgi:hypothetical protein